MLYVVFIGFVPATAPPDTAARDSMERLASSGSMRFSLRNDPDNFVDVATDCGYFAVDC